MKRRLDPAEFTEEDKVTWLLMGWKTPWCHLDFAGTYAAGDRGDADLMFWAQYARWRPFPGGRLPPLVMSGLYGDIQAGGCLP
jgi:hypothetical protein